MPSRDEREQVDPAPFVAHYQEVLQQRAQATQQPAAENQRKRRTIRNTRWCFYLMLASCLRQRPCHLFWGHEPHSPVGRTLWAQGDGRKER